MNNFFFQNRTSHGQRSQGSNIFFQYIFIHMEWIYLKEKGHVPPDREKNFWFHYFFQRKKKYKKNPKSFYTVVMCSLLIFLCICRLYIIVTKDKNNNNYHYYYHYYYYMVLYEKLYWKNIKALFIGAVYRKKATTALFFNSLIYLSLHWNQKYDNFPIGHSNSWYPLKIYLWVPTVTDYYI